MSGNSSTHVWVTDATNTRGGYWKRAAGTADGAAVVSPNQLAIEEAPGTLNAIGVAIPKWNQTMVTASSAVSNSSPAFVGTITVTVVTAVGVINVRNGGVAGEIREIIPAATAKGTVFDLDGGIFGTDLYIEFNGGATGTLRVNWWPKS